MRKLKKIVITLFILIPLISIFYKTVVLDLSLIPKSSLNEYKIQITYDLKKLNEKLEKSSYKLPVLSNTQNQQIYSSTLNEEKTYPIVKSNSGELIKIENRLSQKFSTQYEIKLTDSPKGSSSRTGIPQNELSVIKKKYLKVDKLSPELREKLKSLVEKFSYKSKSSKEIVKKIYFYVTEEIALDSEINDIDEALNLSYGSELAKAKLMAYLSRISGVPSRINLAYKIEETGSKITLKKTYIPEVIIGKSWYPVNINSLTFTRMPDKHIILYKNYEAIKDVTSDEFIKLSISPIMVNKVDSVHYQKKLASLNKFLSYSSLHSLPLNVQNSFYIILLIPLGTLILSLARNMIGLKSFGIFTPILLTLFFLETSLIAGLIFFTSIILIGYIERNLLEKFYLLGVPRLSVLLTLVIISYCALTLLAYHNLFFFPGGVTFNYLPIVILTGFIERFSVQYQEEGGSNTFKALFGTFLISFFCYILFEIETLKLLLFNNPEILLFIIALNLLIGSYKGYRLSEAFRFREFKNV